VFAFLVITLPFSECILGISFIIILFFFVIGTFPDVIKVEFFAVFTCLALQCAIYPFGLYASVVRVSFQQKLLKVTVASIVSDKICTFHKPC